MKNLEKFKNILDEIKSLSKKVKETEKKSLSIFDIGGKGYYENPASDILGFYLSSKCPIYKPILKVFLDFCELPSNLDVSGVKLEREVTTLKGNRIDIIIRGKDWLIAIENKIRHYLSNDLDDYENYVNSNYSSCIKYFFVLSNSDCSSELNGTNWKNLNWFKLLERFNNVIVENINKEKDENLKWWYFFKDFVLCLKNEFNGDLTMDEEIRRFFCDKDNYEAVNNLIDKRNEYLNDNLIKIQKMFKDDAEVKGESNKTLYRLTLKKQSENSRRIDILIFLNYNGEWFFNFYFWKNEIKSNNSKEEKNIIISEKNKNDFFNKYTLQPKRSWNEKDYLGPIWCFEYPKRFNSLEDICKDVKDLIIKINDYFV